MIEWLKCFQKLNRLNKLHIISLVLKVRTEFLLLIVKCHNAYPTHVLYNFQLVHDWVLIHFLCLNGTFNAIRIIDFPLLKPTLCLTNEWIIEIEVHRIFKKSPVECHLWVLRSRPSKGKKGHKKWAFHFWTLIKRNFRNILHITQVIAIWSSLLKFWID